MLCASNGSLCEDTMSNKLKMTLLIDEMSHPDLYAHLSTIDGLRNRTERVRYLAGMGLMLTRKALMATTPVTDPLQATPTASTEKSTQLLPPSGTAAAPQVLGAQELSRIPVDSKTPIPDEATLSTFRNPTDTPPAAFPQSGQQVTSVTVDTLGASDTNTPADESPAAKAARRMAQAGLFGTPSVKKAD